MTIESRISVFTFKITTFLLNWANFGLNLCKRRKWHIRTMICASHTNWISFIFIWNFSLRNKVQAHSHSKMLYWGMDGPEVGGCLGGHYLAGSTLRRMSVAEIWRDLKIQSKVFRSIFKNFWQMLQDAERRNTKIPFPNFPCSPAELPLISMTCQACINSGGMDPGEKWTKDRKKERLNQGKEKFCG